MKKLKMLAIDSYLVNFGFNSQIPAIRYQCHCTHMFPIKCKMVVESFGRIITTVFEKNGNVHHWLFLGQFRLNLESRLSDVDVIAHIGPP